MVIEPKIMGILNVTPDSFSDGGKFCHHNNALQQAQEMVGQGADIIDIGGESTRPGAKPVSLQEEMDRVLPVIEQLTNEVDVTISIDTSKPQVMTEAVKAGAKMINDVYALRLDGALEAAAKCGVPVCLMHMQGEPRTMQDSPYYKDIISEVSDFFVERMNACIGAGINIKNIILDPGFGFGKTVKHNLQIVANLQIFLELGRPILLGVSRKSTIGKILDREVDQRLAGSLALSSLAVANGAAIIRTHDVRPTVDALKITSALIGELDTNDY